MKNNLPCEIVKDLLPSYIDHIVSQTTEEAVEEHLQNCEECKKNYEEMQNGISLEETLQSKDNTQEEKEIVRKIHKKVNKKVCKVALFGVLAVLLVMIISQLLFNTNIREIPAEEVEVSVQDYPMKDIASKANIPNTETYDFDKAAKVDIKTGEEENYTGDAFTILIPDAESSVPALNFTVSEGIVDEYDTVSVITWKSKYYLRDIEWETNIVDGKKMVFIKGYRTTFLNGENEHGTTQTNSVYFGNIDQVIFLSPDGTKTNLWEKE